MRPNALRAMVLEGAYDVAQNQWIDSLREAGIAADVGEQDGSHSGNVTSPLDLAKSRLANRADVRIHCALRDAKNPERQRQRTTNWDRHAHLIPTAAADARMI